MIGRWVAYEIGTLQQLGMSSQEAAESIRNHINNGHNYFPGGVDRGREVLDYLNKYYKMEATR